MTPSNKSDVKSEMKKVLSRIKAAQAKMHINLKKQAWVDEAKKYAERQSKEVKKLLAGDVAKLKTFIERERRELDRFQKQIPGEVKKLRDFLIAQRKDFERLLANVRKSSAAGSRTTSKKKSVKKKTTAKSANS